MKKLALFLVLLAASFYTHSHGGRTDSNGGHTNRKTGEYHCHREPCFTNKRKPEKANEEEKREFSTRYDRKKWPHWVDYDGDCQDARAEALIAASSVPVKFKRNKGCIVTWGKWFDPYTGKTFEKASDLDVDHIVPLKEAHISGGHLWDINMRRRFANDPKNLLVVSAGENREKGAKDPSQWLPDTEKYHCDYIAAWAYIKRSYDLKIDRKEQKVIDNVLGKYGVDKTSLKCPD